MLRKFSYVRASSIKEAVTAAARPGARILAGGTDLLVCLRNGILAAETVVSINGIKELKGIGPKPGGGFRIGALTTLTEIAENKQLPENYTALAQAAAAAASPQLRNQGTIGGNLCQRPRCWYFRGDFQCLRKSGDQCFAMSGENQNHAIFGWDRCAMVHPSDTAAALVAFDAKVTIAGPKGVRTIPLASFFVLPKESVLKENVLAPGEFITEVSLDAPRPGTRSVYRKVRERGAFDFALAGAAVVLTKSADTVQSARIVLSGVAPAPWRAAAAEQALAGKRLGDESIAAAAAAAVKDANPFGDNEFKVALVRGILEEVLSGMA